MSTCNICQFQVTDQSVTQCPNCGAEIKQVRPDEYLDDDSSTDTEPDNVQSKVDLPDDPSQDVTVGMDDDLEICSPGDFLSAQQADNEPETTDQIESTSPSPPATSSDSDQESNDRPENGNNGELSNDLKKLSKKQAESIRSNLLGPDDSPASPADAIGLTSNGDFAQSRSIASSNNSNNAGADSNQVSNENIPENVPEKLPAIPPPAKAKAIRGVAYFHKNFIQLTGQFKPVSGEEMVIGSKHYLLTPKKIKPQYTVAAFSVLLVVLLALIGSQFISPTVPGDGAIVGLVVGPNGRPTSSKIEIAIIGLGKKTGSDPAGFFRFDRVPPGIYQVEFSFPNGKTGSASISVIDNQVTTLVLGKDSQFQNQTLASASSQSTQRDINPGRSPKTKATTQTEKPKSQTSQPPPKSVKPAKKYSALKLKANVENARLIVNGQVLGVGNLTYKKLNPGTHKATVSRSGYNSWSGKIKLTADKTFTLSVELTKAVVETAEVTYNAQDYYQSAQKNLDKSNYSEAIAEFGEAISLDPSMADAIMGRAEAYQATGNKSGAEADYIRAGEIFASKKRTSSAQSAFKEALEINNKSLPALLNQAILTGKSGDREAALKGYKAVLRIDKNNFRANFEIGKIYYAMGKHRDADKKLKKAREVNRSDPKVYHYLMLNYFAKDDFKRVKKVYGEFQKNIPEEEVQAFRDNMRFDAILRIVGEYKRP